ncbi:TPA: G5 domain-containing protein [Streptococcus pneumoniae]|uniref:G5 domain-containing protein n=1 Tax=Streptococcus mitis TaxID=28037 RepID=UPI0010F00B89|nr:G5 domain-containing protein [Streptococcus mitis]CAG5284422.1 putative IgA-specific zinc metalloproteinase [Streptococcus pneumoniae]VJF40412.1 putative IgA-specific zinc metalloproteinase [Streptococcus pneumoniae]VKQ62036.1 putative IgA-specific zinc metalloproteinase [Streptococcus pneumoniae]VSL26519.1 putative IgA-specific zinc metalloproteinase [Streptococcus pneumoniae]HEW9216247.1 G5 domain-containing protein [Streptococcus pneumoniae]
MKKWKKRCIVILGLTVLGFANLVEVVTPFVETTKVYAQEKGDGYSNSLKFSGTTTTSKSQVTYHDPMDLIQIIDLSGSLSDSEFERANGVAGGRKQQINDMIYVIENKLTDEDHVMLAFNGTNTEDSYKIGDREGSDITRLLTKKEAIDLLKELNSNEEVHSMSLSSSLISSYVSPLLESKKYSVSKNFPIGTGFEDVYKAQTNKNKQVSVLQFTDDWSSYYTHENIDTSFADWAKSNAKTFMTVIDSKDGKNTNSYEQLVKAGHPNIKVFTKLDTPNRQEDIAKLFESTALVVVNKTIKQKGTVSISPEADLTLTSAELVSPNGQKTPLTITNNTVSWSGDLDNGSYTVNYTFTGTPSVERSIRGSVTVDGKKVDEKINTLRPEKIAFETKYEEDPSLAAGQEKEKQAGSEGSQLVSLKDGKVISTTITKPKVDRIVLRGTKGSDVEVKTEDIPFNTTYTEDPELEIGQTKVLTEGAVGQTEITKTYVTQSGKRVGDPTVTEKILKKAVDKVIAKGTKGQDVDVAESDIAFKTVYTEDPELEFGQEKIVTEGVLGIKRTTKTYVTQKGVRTKDEPSIKEEVLKEAVDKVVARGSKSAVATKELDYKTTYVEDKESEAGKKTVVTKGSKGHETTTITYSFNSETGEVTANEPKVEKTEPIDEVISVGTKPVVTTKDLDYKTKYVEDKESEAGKKTVVTKGSKGHETTKITYRFNSETGEVTANEPKIEKTESVDEVISVGTKPKVEIRETEFKTEKRENKDLKKGEEKIIQAGVKGRETITTTYYLDPDTGEVKENKPSLEKVDPVNEIIEVGTQAEKVLPNTGTSLSNFLTLTGIIGIVLGISVIIYRKLNKK